MHLGEKYYKFMDCVETALCSKYKLGHAYRQNNTSTARYLTPSSLNSLYCVRMLFYRTHAHLWDIKRYESVCINIFFPYVLPSQY